MKQSKKLLSIFLAMLMLLGTVSVVANAAQQKVEKGNIAYDSIDNAVLTPEQVANTILDVVDQDIMSGLEPVNLNLYVTKINIDLTSIDTTLSDVYDLLDGSLPGLAGGDVKTLANEKGRLQYDGHTVQRSDGDLEVVYCLLDFLGNSTTAGIVSKAPYGLLVSGGIEAGGLVDMISGLIDLSSINDILQNLDAFATEMVYDMLIPGSFNDAYADDSYPSVSELEEAGQGLPSEVSTIDKMLNTAAYNLLTKPQKYEYVPTGEYTTDEDGNQVPVTEKVWDLSSTILTKDKLQGKDLTLQNNSIFSLLDTLLQTAYEDFGTVALNHDVKKLFMEAMGVDFVTLDPTDSKDAQEIATIKADADYIDVENNDSRSAQVKNYFCNAQMWEVNGTWYFRDYVTRPILDANGNLQYTTDDEGNQVVVEGLQHRYQRAEAYNANDLYGLFNWDYKLTSTTFNFDQLLTQYGSIIGCLNHILHVILEVAVNPTALGISSIDELWADGDNSHFNENLMTTAKFLLKNFTFDFFGRNPAYVNLNTLEATDEFIAKIDSFGNDAEGREGLIAYMLLPFLGDALPQLVYDLDMFTPGLQIEQTAALLVREFLSDLTPQINYDDEIFVDASLATGRTFKTYTSAQWFELILNMGLDLAAVYLDNISNFNVDLNTLETIKGYAVAAGDPAWMGVLEEIVDWAVEYVADGTGYSVIAGLEPATLGSVRCVTGYNHTNDTVTVANNYAGNNSAFNILSKALNTLLPLGLLVDVSSDAYALDVKMVFDKLIDVIDDLDLEVLLGVFGRNNRDDNILGTKNVAIQVLGVVNKLIRALFGVDLLVANASAAEPINNALSDANLKTTIYNLLTGLNNRKTPLLRSALPVVAVFVDDWGSEQAIRTPNLDIDNVTYASDGSLSTTVTITNGSRGLWRGYMKNGARAQDEQYAYNIQSITTAQGGSVAISDGYAGKLDFGGSKTFTINGTIPAAGLADRLDITYQVYNEDGQLMDGGKSYSKAYFTYYAYSSEEWNHINSEDYEQFVKKAVIFGVEADENGKLQYTEEMTKVGDQDYGRFYHEKASNGKHYSFEPQSQPGNGFTAVASSNDDCDKETDYWYKPISFNSANYTPVDAAAGQTLSFTFKAYSKYSSWGSTKYAGWHEKDNSSYPTTYIKIYDTVAMDELRALVEQETGLNRRPETYKAEGDYYGWLGTLADAITVAWNPGVDGSFRTDAAQVLANLEAAIEKLEAAKMTPAEQAAAGLETVDAAVNTLESTLKSVDGGLGGKDYRTYMLYRWHRYQDARNDANRAINLAAEYNAGLQTQKFEYSSMPVYKLKEAVANDKYEDYILALLKDLNEEELAQAKENFANVTKQYGGYTTLDIAQTSNLLTRMSQRLILRNADGPTTTYLEKEINSAKAVFGTNNTKGYSTRSWKAYTTALANAEAALTSDSQDAIFNAKYALQVARNNLRTAEMEADYTELETLVAQAKTIFDNTGLYDNTNAEFGALLAAYGYEVEDADGNTTQLFPGSANTIINVSIDKGDQEDVDDVADTLKKALSKMVFKNTNYGSNTVVSTNVPTGETDENDMPITESVKTTELTAKQLIEAVKGKFQGTTASGATDTEVRISLEDDYTIDNGGEKFVGTGATITIYTTQSSVKIPLSTIKVVVKGDTTGDGVIDVLDCMIIELAATDNTTITGVYNIAADVDGVAGISVGDLSFVANEAAKA